MKKTKSSKKPQKKTKASAGAKAKSAKAKLPAKAKSARRKAPKAKAAAKRKAVVNAKASPKIAPKTKARRVPPGSVQMGSQDVETVPMKGRARTARAGAGAGDFGGISVVEDADSESVEELLEEGQTFEAGVVRGVEQADDEVEQEVHTREVLQDDVPNEYDDDDRP
jgi:hypothetical protein